MCTGVAVGLRATLGVGVFVGLAPAAALAGQWLVPAMVLAAVAAACAAYASAELAYAHQNAGDGDGYAPDLGRWPSRMAASAELVGRATAAAAAAGTLGSAVVPDRPAVGALGAIAVATAVDVAGVPVRSRTTWVLAGTVIAVLGLVVIACFAIAPPPVAVSAAHDAYGPAFPAGMLAGAGVFFVAFAGFEGLTTPYADGPRYSPRQLRVAIPLLLLIVLAVYAAVVTGVVRQLGVARLALSPAPLHDALVAADAAALTRLVDLGTGLAMLSVLVVLLTGMRKRVLALARDGDSTAPLARPGRRHIPWRSGVVCALGVAGVALLLPRVVALELCAGCLLAYYGLTHAVARKLGHDARIGSLCMAWLGLGLSVIIAIGLPMPVLAATAIVLLGGACLVALVFRRWR